MGGKKGKKKPKNPQPSNQDQARPQQTVPDESDFPTLGAPAPAPRLQTGTGNDFPALTGSQPQRRQPSSAQSGRAAGVAGRTDGASNLAATIAPAPSPTPGPAPKPVPIKQPQVSEQVVKDVANLSLLPKEQNRNLAEKIGFDFSWNR